MKILYLGILCLFTITCNAQVIWEIDNYYAEKGNEQFFCDSTSVEIVNVKECHCVVEQTSKDPFGPIPIIKHNCVKEIYTKHCMRSVWKSAVGKKKDVLVWNGELWAVVRKDGTYWYFTWEAYTIKL